MSGSSGGGRNALSSSASFQTFVARSGSRETEFGRNALSSSASFQTPLFSGGLKPTFSPTNALFYSKTRAFALEVALKCPDFPHFANLSV